MSSSREKEGGYFQVYWHIENLQFSWHKTGERLESPLFKINLSDETSWRLHLYPRGEDDGEYLNCYLFREKGGPEVVEVNYEFILKFGSISKSQFYLEIQPFKIHQREGLKFLLSRREMFAIKAAHTEIFCFECKIFSYEADKFQNSVPHLFTRIQMDRIYGTDIFDDETNFVSDSNKYIEVKSILKEKSLINIQLSYGKDGLVIKIHPMSCNEIKYATCKIVLLKNWGKEFPIEYARSWIGKIKKDVLRYELPRLETKSTEPSPVRCSHKSFIFNYDFAFSTGIVEEEYEMKEYATYKKEYAMYVETLNLTMQQFFNDNLKSVNCSPTVLDSLEDVYNSKSSADIDIADIPTHKSILCARSRKFMSIIQDDALEGDLPVALLRSSYADFVRFLYTDSAKITSNAMATGLYQLAWIFEVELLMTKCRNYLIDRLNYMNAHLTLFAALTAEDSILETAVENYIVSYYDLVVRVIAKKNVAYKHKLRKKILFLKYKK